MWFAVVYDAAGTLIATATTADLLVEAIETDGVLEMRYRDELPKYKTYRGQMRLLVTPNGLQTINVLPIESYLRGVVPAEVPATWPIEAVKSQAVAARTYAWSRLKGATREWDVVPTAANQVYGGYQHEHLRSDEAVVATQNIVLTYQGKVISALYHAAAGGHTENSEYAFVNDRGDPGSKVAYLRGKPDVDENGVPYDGTAGSYAWQSDQFTMAELSAMLSQNPLTDVGDIHNITYWRGVSGRVYKVLLEGSEGSKTVSGGKFKNTYNDYKLSGKNTKSTLFYLTPVTP
jgi:stage II sporulation protein D